MISPPQEEIAKQIGDFFALLSVFVKIIKKNKKANYVK